MAIKTRRPKKQPPRVAGHELRFPLERDFTAAIAALLTRLPWGIKGVQILHGPREAGKDIVFTLQGAFGEPILCACVAKNFAISGSVDRPQGALTILNQVQQAFKIPYIGEAGEKIAVQRVYIVTPHTISLEARHSLENQLIGDVQFIGGSQLFDLFRTHWKDFLSDEFDGRFKDTTDRLSSNETLKNVAVAYHTAAPDRSLQDVYVKPCFYRSISEYQVSPQFSKFLDLRTLRPKTIPNPESRYDPSVPQRIQSSPPRWIITDSDIRSKREYLVELRGLFDVFDQIDILPPSGHELLPRIKQLIDHLESVRVNAQNKAMSGKHTEGMSSFETIHGELTSQALSDLIHKADRLRSALDSCGLLIQKQLDRMLADAGNIVSMESFSDPEFIQASRADRVLFSVRSDLLLRLHTKKLQLPSDLTDSVKILLITAPAGYGKTSFCRWHALQDVERYNNHQRSRVPVYVALHKLSEDMLTSFEAAFFSRSAHALIAASNDGQTVTINDVKFYLDGFDEVASPSARTRIVELVRNATTNEALRLIMTSRDYVVGPELHWMPYVSLGELTEEQTQELIARWLSGEQLANFNAQIGRSSDLSALLRTPLVATLTLLVFKQTGNLPGSRTRLYETFVDLMLSGWDMAKGINRGSQISAAAKFVIVRRLAWSAHSGRMRELSRDAVRAVVETLPLRVPRAVDVVIAELSADGIITGNQEVFQFPHLSFQEYLAARDLLGDPRGARLNYVLDRYLLGDTWWKEILSFYVSMASREDELREWVQQRATKLRRTGPTSIVDEGAARLITDINEAVALLTRA